MTIWTCKGAVAALALTTLAACEDGQGGDIFRGLQSDTSKRSVAFSQANMVFGAVTLVAPDGFCIDKKTLKQNFALMARCDALGASSASVGVPVGVITASFSTASATIPTPLDTAGAHNLSAVTDAIAEEDRVTFRAIGAAPTAELSDTHWRGTARVGSHMLGLALYGPASGRAVSSEGRAILGRLIDRLDTGS